MDETFKTKNFEEKNCWGILKKPLFTCNSNNTILKDFTNGHKQAKNDLNPEEKSYNCRTIKLPPLSALAQYVSLIAIARMGQM
jgi:hypothetical protein